MSEYHGAINSKPAQPMLDQTHGTMYFDGRYKVIVYEGHEVGEIYDLVKDPNEFNNLWWEVDFEKKKNSLVYEAFKGYMSMVGPGVRRKGKY